ALTNELVTAVLPNNAALEQLRKAHLMVAVAKGATLQFNLESTGKVLPAISNCMAKVKSGGLASAGDFSAVPPTPKPAVKPVVQAAAPAPTPTPAKPAKTTDISGTGIVISANGHVITNYHVIGSCISDIRGNLTGQGAATLRTVS